MSTPREPKVGWSPGPQVAFGRWGSPVPCHCWAAGGGLGDAGHSLLQELQLLLAPPSLSKATNTQKTPMESLRRDSPNSRISL